jgi:hypothetical protein
MPADFLLNDRKRTLASLVNRHFEKSSPEVRQKVEEAVRRANPALDPEAEIAKDTVVLIPDVPGAQRKPAELAPAPAATTLPALAGEALAGLETRLKRAARDIRAEAQVELKALSGKSLHETLQKQAPKLARTLDAIIKTRKDEAEKSDRNAALLLEKIGRARVDLERLMK